ncbi:MAG: hypothetical protein CL840_05075 [Crocinitomicaceae bacterium]|nr:hypothetical protein [Crocinitomicaceae bacterium]|tara:strand:+ start:3635 stop:3934 length:300 start_codon:yes stop_codon:yes gene_type:complete
MKKSLKNIIITAIICFSFSIVSFAQDTEYVTVIQFKNALHISGTSTPFEIVKVKTEHQIDFKPLFVKVKELEAEGWEMYNQQIDAANYPSMTIWLRKKN